MPISCYWSLVSLARHGERVSGWVKQIRKTFSRFAFVIHDPTTHTEFDAALNNSFDDLDQMTGEHLLFFALVRPESADIDGLKQRRYYRLFQEHSPGGWELKQLVSPEAILASPDPSLSAWAFANALGIAFDALPCIVTTNDLLNSDIEVLQTSPDTLVRQLLDLGKAETRRHRTHADAHEHGSLFPDEQPGRSTARLSRSLASTLATVLGAAHASDLGSQHGPVCHGMYREAFTASLHELLTDLRHARVAWHADTEPSDEFQQLALTIAGILQTLAPQQDPIFPTLTEALCGDAFDHETRIMLRTGVRCLTALAAPPWLGWKSQQHLRAPFGEAVADIDFSPSLISFAKAFENEMNLSVVHWIRRRLGVSLPAYFKRPQPGVDATYTPASVPHGQPIDFNFARRGEWLPPSLGQAELACAKLAGGNPPEHFDPETWERLMQAWQVIRSKRNHAAHPRLIDRHDCESVILQMTALIEAGVFRSTSTLKGALRGDPN